MVSGNSLIVQKIWVFHDYISPLKGRQILFGVVASYRMVSGNSLNVQKITYDFWKKGDDENIIHVKIMLANFSLYASKKEKVSKKHEWKITDLS